MDSKIKVLYGFGLGLILSDIIPTPADGLYFYRQRINKERLQNGEITPKQYWIKDAINYYALNPLWWGGVILATHYFGKDFKQKRNILIGLVAGGVVLGVISKNIKKDTENLKKSNTTNI